MILSCPNCGTRYTVAPASLPVGGRKVRCAKCGEVWRQVPEEEVASMAPGAMVFALANPTPEVHPDVARRHAAIVATGRSDFPNQINNVLAFPGIFRGALDAGATRITEAMKLAAAHAIADLVPEPTADRIVPSVFQEGVAEAVAAAVRDLASDAGSRHRSAPA